MLQSAYRDPTTPLGSPAASHKKEFFTQPSVGQRGGGMNKIFGFVVCGLWSAVLVMGCGQQPKAQDTAKNEVIVASTPITVPTAPAQPLPQLTELAQGKKSSSGTPIEKIARNKAIQLALRNANFYSGEIDGKIGPKTKEAVKKFQVSKNLTMDGIVGARTWAELRVYLPQEQTDREKQ